MLSQQVKSYIPIIIDFLKGQPVMKAWLFGSCSRGEESIDSDIDLLVDYDYDAGASLMTVSGIRIGLKKLLNREVDIVENGCLLPFAAPSAQRDKILIYERGHEIKNVSSISLKPFPIYRPNPLNIGKSLLFLIQLLISVSVN